MKRSPEPRVPPLRSDVPAAVALFVGALVVYTATNFAGIRSPDSEIVFRTGESVASLRGGDVDPLAIGPHGVAPGLDGKWYSVYPPVESLLLAPFIALAHGINRSGWYESHEPPPSFYVGSGLAAFLFDVELTAREAHATRFLVSWVNPVLGSAIVVVFFLILRRMTRSRIAALSVAILFAFGTLQWHYSGTFFSEQPGTLFVLLSFLLLTSTDPNWGARSDCRAERRLFASGVLLALAFGAHVSALLFAPFLGLYAYRLRREESEGFVAALGKVAPFVVGYAVVSALLGAYNLARFGSFFETGRTITSQQSAIYAWRTITTPLHELVGLLVGSGKGLFLFCPAIVLGILTWPWLHRRHAALSVILASAALFRVALISSLTIWHGGFCLGPRYVVMLIPFLLLPSALWLDDRVARGAVRAFAAFAAFTIACAVQQLYFTIGDIFGFSQLIVWSFESRGADIFASDRIYLDWKLSPLFQLHHAPRAPWMLRGIPWSNLTLWAAGSGALALGLAAVFLKLWRSRPS